MTTPFAVFYKKEDAKSASSDSKQDDVELVEASLANETAASSFLLPCSFVSSFFSSLFFLFFVCLAKWSSKYRTNSFHLFYCAVDWVVCLNLKL